MRQNDRYIINSPDTNKKEIGCNFKNCSRISFCITQKKPTSKNPFWVGLLTKIMSGRLRKADTLPQEAGLPCASVQGLSLKVVAVRRMVLDDIAVSVIELPVGHKTIG